MINSLPSQQYYKKNKLLELEQDIHDIQNRIIAYSNVQLKRTQTIKELLDKQFNLEQQLIEIKKQILHKQSEEYLSNLIISELDELTELKHLYSKKMLQYNKLREGNKEQEDLDEINILECLEEKENSLNRIYFQPPINTLPVAAFPTVPPPPLSKNNNNPHPPLPF
jgi:hypothetical protein